MELSETDNERPVVVLVTRCFVLNEEGKILLVQRSKKDTNNPRKWEVPGGKLDPGQDLSDAREREVIEETGLYIMVTEKDCFAETFVCTKGKYLGLPYLALFSITKIVGGKFRLSEEHDDYAWVNYEDMLDYDLEITVYKAAAALRDKLTTT